jgi:hypothetical protein
MRPQVDTVAWAHFCEPPSFSQASRGGTPSQKAGRSYERWVQRTLCNKRFDYLPSPWIKYYTGDQLRFCQPDGLLIDPFNGLITVVEIKLSHTEKAWYQIRKLYQPILKKIFPERMWDFRAVEICNTFNPDVTIPEEIEYSSEIFTPPSARFGVVVWTRGQWRYN